MNTLLQEEQINFSSGEEKAFNESYKKVITRKKMKLTKEFIQKTKIFQTPFLAINLKKIIENYGKIKKSLSGVEVFYSVKANDHPKIIQVLASAGASFDVTSAKELESVLRFRVPHSKITCLNPIKSPEFLATLKKNKINTLAFDSFDEVEKISKYAPGSKVILRIVVNNEGSDWPLTKKYGVDAAEAITFMKYAQKKGLDPIGLTFHVGSQCLNKNNWVSALYICDNIWDQAKKENIHLNFLSLGGGIPIKHSKKIPSISEIGNSINGILEKKFKVNGRDTRIAIEPGRGLVGDAGIMVTSVIGKAKRDFVEDWIYIDIGVFNGLMETIEGFMYEIKTDKSRRKKIVTIGGPSCDSVDIPFKNVMINDVKIGERLYVINSSAYTTVYASSFNGFEPPKVYFI